MAKDHPTALPEMLILGPKAFVAATICRKLDVMWSRAAWPYEELIACVQDRPGHDRRYAIDARKIRRDVGSRPAETIESGIDKTVRWYLDNPIWVDGVRAGAYRQWIETQYAGRAA